MGIGYRPPNIILVLVFSPCLLGGPLANAPPFGCILKRDLALLTRPDAAPDSNCDSPILRLHPGPAASAGRFEHKPDAAHIRIEATGQKPSYIFGQRRTPQRSTRQGTPCFEFTIRVFSKLAVKPSSDNDQLLVTRF